MTITKTTIKFLGNKVTLYRVLDSKGEVLQVLESQEEAAAWIAAQ